MDQLDDRREAEPVGDREQGAAARELDAAAEAAGGDAGGRPAEAALHDREGVDAGTREPGERRERAAAGGIDVVHRFTPGVLDSRHTPAETTDEARVATTSGRLGAN